MYRLRISGALALLSLCLFPPVASGTDLPASFPGDVPVADYMEVTSVMEVRDSLMIDFNAPGQTMDGVAEWYIAEMTAAGWDNTSDGGHARSRILVFMKGDRRCGIMVTNFILTQSMQMDESIKKVQLQCSGGSDAGEASSASSAAEAAMTAEDAVTDDE